VYANVASNNDRNMSDTVVYSELLKNDDDDDVNHVEGPAGDLYAQVQKDRHISLC